VGACLPDSRPTLAQLRLVTDYGVPIARLLCRPGGAQRGLHRRPHSPSAAGADPIHSISTPRSRREPTRSKAPLERGGWFKARSARAVGATQLTVSGNHGHPNLSGSNRTWRSAVRNFHCQNQLASLPAVLSSQRSPFSRAGMAGTRSRTATATSDVTREPSWSSPANAGQLPFGFCARSRKR
jgi:hypothetical protein